MLPEGLKGLQTRLYCNYLPNQLYIINKRFWLSLNISVNLLNDGCCCTTVSILLKIAIKVENKKLLFMLTFTEQVLTQTCTMTYHLPKLNLRMNRLKNTRGSNNSKPKCSENFLLADKLCLL